MPISSTVVILQREIKTIKLWFDKNMSHNPDCHIIECHITKVRLYYNNLPSWNMQMIVRGIKVEYFVDHRDIPT